MRSADVVMRAANPVPDPAIEFDETEIAALLTLIRAGSTPMESNTKQPESTTHPAPNTERRTRGPLVAAAVFAMVLAVVGAVWLISNDTDDPSATPTTQTTPSTQAATTTTSTPTTTVATPSGIPLDEEAFATVEAFVDDINSGDFVSAGETIAQASQFNMAYIPDVDQDWVPYAQGMYEYWTYVDSHLTVAECKTLTSGNTRCEVSRDHDEIFTDAPENFIIQIRLDGNAIAFMSQTPVRPDDYWDSRRDFDDWLYEETNGKGDADSYNLWFFYDQPEERANLVQTYARAWVDAGRPKP